MNALNACVDVSVWSRHGGWGRMYRGCGEGGWAGGQLGGCRGPGKWKVGVCSPRPGSAEGGRLRGTSGQAPEGPLIVPPMEGEVLQERQGRCGVEAHVSSCVHMRAWAHVSTCVCTCIRVLMCVSCTRERVHAYVCACGYVCVCMCAHMCAYVCVSVCGGSAGNWGKVRSRRAHPTAKKQPHPALLQPLPRG